MLQTDLLIIAEAATEKHAENESFKSFLARHDAARIDELVLALDKITTAGIDCTQCGNCCRTLMINVEEGDAARLAAHLNMNIADFENRYVEKSSAGTLAVMNTIPCHFLSDNKCVVYEARPNECREFPGLHKPGFNDRLFATFMHYGRCPIIYNVI